ncbi:hypothetical protein J6590_093591, partial [Homalodisca vitripennis]
RYNLTVGKTISAKFDSEKIDCLTLALVTSHFSLRVSDVEMAKGHGFSRLMEVSHALSVSTTGLDAVSVSAS